MSKQIDHNIRHLLESINYNDAKILKFSRYQIDNYINLGVQLASLTEVERRKISVSVVDNKLTIINNNSNKS